MPAIGEDLRCVTFRDPAGGATSAFVPAGEPGPAVPLFAVPALGLDGRSFAPLAPLAAERRLVFWNTPNELPCEPGLAALAATVMTHADRAGMPERFVLLGSSLGAMAALAAAIAAPGRVAGLVLSGGTARWSDIGLLTRLTRFAHPFVPSRVYHRVLPWVLAPGDTSDPVLAAIHVQMRHRTKAYAGAVIAALAGGGGFDLTPRVSEVRAPTLVLHSLRDGVAPWRATRALAAIPRARVVAIDGASHVPYLSDADRFLGPLREFLATVDAGERA